MAAISDHDEVKDTRLLSLQWGRRGDALEVSARARWWSCRRGCLVRKVEREICERLGPGLVRFEKERER